MTEFDPQLEQSLSRLVARVADRDPNWRDVERRAASARRRLGVVWIAAGLLFAVGAATGFGFGGGLWSLVAGKPVSPDRLSPEERRLLASMSSGEPVLRTEPDSPLLRNLGRRVSIRLLATRGGRSFYVIRVQGPQPRYCTSIARRGDVFGALECSPLPFPSPDRPVADFSVFFQRPSDPQPRVGRLTGFAADGVDKVGFLDSSGKLVAPVPVVDNTYLRETGIPTSGVTAIAAFTRDGKRVFCEDIGRGVASPDPCGDRAQQRAGVPPPTLPPPPPPTPSRLGAHLQHGSAQGV
ncbi:MAG TPA: hypothetical protein VE269_01850, partial [Gaiellaceae bacterium]|nr:hypothetical protein [Gaiellaceae bacterium]